MPTNPVRPVRYIVRGILPRGEVSILSGASGAGKTTFIMQLLGSITKHDPTFFKHEIRYPVRVGYLAADRTWDSYEELAQRVGLDTSLLQVISVVDDPSINVNRLERDSMGLLRDILGRFESVDLVVIDPMVVFLGVDPNKYNQVAPRLINMGRWCKETGTTILATHHATKARTDYSFKRPQDRISGSSALLGFTSSQLFLSASDEIGKPYSEFCAVNHNDPPETIRLSRNDAGLFIPYEDKSLSKPMVSAVLKTVEGAEGAISRANIMQETKMEPQVLDRILEYLVASDFVKINARGEFRPVVRMGQASAAN